MKSAVFYITVYHLFIHNKNAQKQTVRKRLPSGNFFSRLNNDSTIVASTNAGHSLAYTLLYTQVAI